MPEPLTVVLIGGAVYAWYKSRNTMVAGSALPGAPGSSTPQGTLAPSGNPAPVAPGGTIPTAGAEGAPISTAGAGTTADAPFATNASLAVAAGQDPTLPAPVPADLVAALDNDTALLMRAYVALNPDDFQSFLNQYADRMTLRNDFYLQMLTDPDPDHPIQLTPGMMVGLGQAAYRVGQAINGVAAGKAVDVFGLAASVSKQIPGINEDLVSALQGMAMAYRAIRGINDIITVASAFPGTSIMQLGGLTAGGITAYPGLAALPMAGVLMAVGLVVDIGFTIIGDKPDLQKAIDVALDVASLAVLFIPVIGIVIAIVIQIVKFIIDLFGDELFGSGMSKEQRERIEMAKYTEAVSPMWKQVADSLSPRELFWTIVHWGSGYCGGIQVVAMSVNLVLKAGDQLMVGGQLYTVPNDMLLGFGDNDQAGGCYWLAGGPFQRITNDEQAWALAKYGSTNGVVTGAQVGVSESLQVDTEATTRNVIMARCAPMLNFINHGFTLDQIDQVVAEFRAQPYLKDLSNAFGWPTWQEMLGYIMQDEWARFTANLTHGTFSDFARLNGFPTTYALRAHAFGPNMNLYDPVLDLEEEVYRGMIAMQSSATATLMYQQQQMSMSAP